MRSDRQGSMGRRREEAGRRVFWGAVAVALLFCVLGVGRTWARVAVLDRMYRLEQARAENARLVAEAGRLELERAALERTARVSRASQERLKLAPPSADRVVAVPAVASGVVGVEGVAVEGHASLSSHRDVPQGREAGRWTHSD